MIITANNLNDLNNILTNANNNNQIVILDTYAKWCGPCKIISPYFELLSNDSKYNNIIFVKVDIDIATDINEYLYPKSLPSFYVFNKLINVDEYSGSDKNQLMAFINKYI